ASLLSAGLLPSRLLAGRRTGLPRVAAQAENQQQSCRGAERAPSGHTPILLRIGDWGLRIDCGFSGQSAIRNPQSAIRNDRMGRRVTIESGTRLQALTTLAEDERLFRDSVYEFADREIRPFVREMDDHAKMSREVVAKLFDFGLMGIEIPESYGG